MNKCIVTDDTSVIRYHKYISVSSSLLRASNVKEKYIIFLPDLFSLLTQMLYFVSCRSIDRCDRLILYIWLEVGVGVGAVTGP